MKFVSLSQLLGGPFFGSSFDLFTVPGFIVLLVALKKKDGRKKRCIGRERRSRTRRKERKKELKEKNTLFFNCIIT